MSRVRAISKRANRLAALKLPISQTQGNADSVLTIHEALYWATDCSDFSTHTRVTLKLSSDAKILEKQGTILLRLVGAWQRRYDAEIEQQEDDEDDEDEEEYHGKIVKRPLVCPFLRPLGLFPLGDPGLVGGLRSGSYLITYLTQSMSPLSTLSHSYIYSRTHTSTHIYQLLTSYRYLVGLHHPSP